MMINTEIHIWPKYRKQMIAKCLIPKGNIHLTSPPKAQGSFRKRCYEKCESQRGWITIRKHLLKKAGQLHVETHSGCVHICKTCTRPSQTETQQGGGTGILNSSLSSGELGNC